LGLGLAFGPPPAAASVSATPSTYQVPTLSRRRPTIEDYAGGCGPSTSPDGTRALTSTGRWHDAEAHLRHQNGIGHRMLDGRQATVIAAATTGDTTTAQKLVAETVPGEPWCAEPRSRCR